MIGLQEDTGPAPQRPSNAPALAARIFAAGGWLQEALDLEHRPQQETMARTVADAMRDDTPLLFEAGTGVGKSLAYLLPGIIHAMDQSRQLIVSTHTISLQEQIADKDLPLCRRFFHAVPELARYAGFKSTVLVGKAHYLCTTRLGHALNDKHDLFAGAEQQELLRIAAWSGTTTTGLRHELQPRASDEVWDLVCADSSGCSRNYCDCTRCFYQRARARADAAQVLIVNHSLLFALIRVGEMKAERNTRGVIRPNDFVVLDEAHTVPDVATDNFGLALTNVGIDRLLRSLFNPKKKKGLLVKLDEREAQLAVGDCIDAAVQFFAFIHDRLLATRPILRVRETGFAEPVLDAPLAQLLSRLVRIEEKLPEGRLRSELADRMLRLASARAGLAQFLSVADDSHVYWAEITGRKRTGVVLRSAPIDVGPRLREVLFGCNTSVVCTSATLALAGRMEPFSKRIGAGDARATLVKSPFDFDRNMRIYVAADIPLPSARDATLARDELADYIRFCTGRVRGGSLVLFTSYSDMRAVAQQLEPLFGEAGRPFLMQGADLSRSELARQMRERGNAVLFGTDSFWTGVDVPGDALAQVIITRLPFDPPTHPITEARCDHIRDQGGNPFNELTLPDALMKFRQGIGRLIRSASDRGLVTILDSRVLLKSYGRLFLESLPRAEFTPMTRESRDEEFQPFA